MLPSSHFFKASDVTVTSLNCIAVNETQEVEFDFNFGLVRFPVFHEEYVEANARFTTYFIDDPREPPFHPQPMPPHTNVTDKMIYLYISDYVINSAAYAAYLSGKLVYTVTPDLVSPLNNNRNAVITMQSCAFESFFSFWIKFRRRCDCDVMRRSFVWETFSKR